MDKSNLPKLSAKISNFSIDHINFARKVSEAHPFDSIDESLDYLEKTLFNISLNKDDLFFVSSEKTPILFANVITESICYIIKESYKLHRYDDAIGIAYYRNKLDNLMIKIVHERDKLVHNERKSNFLTAVLTLLCKVSMVLNPAELKEEDSYGELALFYYNLQFTMYSYLLTLSTVEYDYLLKNRDLYAYYISISYPNHSKVY